MPVKQTPCASQMVELLGNSETAKYFAEDGRPVHEAEHEAIRLD